MVLAILCVVVGFRAEVFFALAGSVGYDYGGSERSLAYSAFLGGASVLIYLVAVHMVATTRHLRLRQLVVLLLPVLFVVAFLIDSALGRVQPASYGHFVLSLAFACPAAVAGMVCADRRVIDRLAFGLEPLILLLTAAVAVSAVSVLSGASRYGGVGGATYQTASYLGALAFNCNLYYVLFGHVGIRPEWTRSDLYRAFTLLLLPLQVGAVLLSGGRGGFVLVAVGAVVQLLLLFAAPSGRRVSRLVLLLAVLVPSVIWGVPWLLANQNAARRIPRVFDYVGDEGLDWSGTSGRDVVYGEALRAIGDESFFGYGLYSWGIDTYPHNILLELVLNGGALYASIWVLVLLVVWIRAVRVLGRSKVRGVIVPLLLYPLVMLQFSGSYMISGPLWFCLSFALCVSSRTESENLLNSRSVKRLWEPSVSNMRLGSCRLRRLPVVP